METSGHVPGLGVVDAAHPELQDVLQRPDTPMSVTVPVKHDGPLFTQELPAVLGTSTQYVLTTSGEKVLNASPFRKRATIISTDNPFLIMPRQSNVGTNTSALWPANVPFIYTATSPLWLATPAGAATVSVITEDGTR